MFPETLAQSKQQTTHVDTKTRWRAAKEQRRKG